MKSLLLRDNPSILDNCDRIARKSLLGFAQACDPDYVAGAFHQFLAKQLERVESGAERRLIITVPPRHGKSRMVSVELPAWMLGRNPKAKIILASYATSLSSYHSRQVRDRITLDPEFRRLFPATAIRRDARASGDWTTTEGGRFLAAGVGSGITGHGADLIIVDDPFKDFAEAHSVLNRENLWNWFLSTLYTRLSPTGRIVIIMTRWHTDDLVGRLNDPERAKAIEEAGGTFHPWKTINLPALAEENDLLGRAEGQALFPERFPVEWLVTQRATLGSYLFSALYQGHPVPKGGNYINAANFVMADAKDVPTGVTFGRYWDLAASENTMADFTVGVRGCVDDHGCLWITDVRRGQWEWPRSRTIIKTVAEAEDGTLLGVEAVSGFKTSAANLREVLPPDIQLKAYSVDRDKLTRALPWIALAEAKKVFLVRGAWNHAFEGECEEFPAGKDDQIDGVSGLYMMLRRSRSLFAG